MLAHLKRFRSASAGYHAAWLSGWSRCWGNSQVSSSLKQFFFKVFKLFQIFRYLNILMSWNANLKKYQKNHKTTKKCTDKSAQSEVYSAAFIKLNRYRETTGDMQRKFMIKILLWYHTSTYWIYLKLFCPQQIKQTQLKSKSVICLQNSKGRMF